LDQEFTFGDTTNTMGGTCMPAADLDKELTDDDSNLPLGKLRSLGRDITVKQNSDLKFKEQTVPHHANTSVASMYIRSIGQNGGTQSGFNSIGQATRRHNQWHSRGQGVVSTGGTRSSKAGGGANGRAYQNRNSSTTSSKKGGGNNAGQMSTKGTNNRRRSKNTIQTKEGALSSLEQEPSGWGELPPTSSNSDIGTSAWGAPTEQRNQTANSSNGVGWGETAAWSGKNRDSNGTRAAGWHRQGAKISPDSQIEKLLEMGFEKEDATRALKSNKYNFDSALGDLLALMSINEAITTPTDSEEAELPSSTHLPTTSVPTTFNSQSPSNATSSNQTVPTGKQSQGSLEQQQLVWPQMYSLPAQGGVVAPGQVGSVPTGNINPAHIVPFLPSGSGANVLVKNTADQLSFQGNNKVQSQLRQQQISQQMLLLQLARMPPQIANLKIRIAQFQVLQQQLLQHHLQLSTMGNSSQVLLQQQQVTQQLLQIKQILHNLQQQLMSSSQQLPTQPPSAAKGTSLPGRPPLSTAGVGGPPQSTFPANRQGKPASLNQPIPNVVPSDSKISTNPMGIVPGGHKPIADPSLPSPFVPNTAGSEGNKRVLPKLDISSFPDSIPEFHPGKPWHPRPKPTEPAQVYGSQVTGGTQPVANPVLSKLSPQAKPFTLASWESSDDKTQTSKTKPDQRDPSLDEISTKSTSRITKGMGSRPQLLTLTNETMETTLPTYGLSSTPLASVWSTAHKNSSEGGDLTEDQGEMKPSSEQQASLWDGPISFGTAVTSGGNAPWGQATVLSPKATSPTWHSVKKPTPSVFKLPSNPPSSWLLIRGLQTEVTGEELKSVCSEYGEIQSFFFNDTKHTALACFLNKEKAAYAKTGLDKTVLNGVTIASDFATDEDIGKFFSEMNSPRVLSPNSLSDFISSKGEYQVLKSSTEQPWPRSQTTAKDNHNLLAQSHDSMPNSKWTGPPLSIPKSEVGQLWSVGNFDSLINYSAPTPTTPEPEEWNYISSSPLTKFLPGGLF
jgi:hypothetical protein